jgi:histidyl-tRNA synthetase
MKPAVKGFRDIEEGKRTLIRNIIEQIFKSYNFQAVETPIIEYEEFVKGDSQDDAISDVFKLQDKGGRKLALRYEFTFQLQRLAKNKKLPYRRYQIGPVFRDEPITGNRFRQITQCDIDTIGSTIKDEAEILKIVSELFKKLNIKFNILINNRKLLNEILDEQKIKQKEQVIREIDKLDKLSEAEVRKNLSKYKAESVLAIFKKPESFFRKYDSYNEILELKKYCKMQGVKVIFQSSLARGLSYYNGTVFEVKSSIKETIAGGGSYSVNNIPATGISFGLDRLEILAKVKEEDKKVLIISINQDKKAIQLASKIRQKVPCSIYYGKPTKALAYANSLNFPYVIFLGEKEAKAGKVKLRDMKTGKEKLVSENKIVI